MITLDDVAGAACAHGAALRPMCDDDLPFSTDLYASIRAEELAQTGWPPATQRAFLDQQHAAQHAHYVRHYAGLLRWIIERDGASIGRLYLHEGDRDIRVVDISLLPHARGSGLGTALLQAVIRSADAVGKSVSIHVERENPARRLYLRLGFAVVDPDRGPYELLERPAFA
jgi:ribosomal protein S18 acetylase RimI-like enzyme